MRMNHFDDEDESEVSAKIRRIRIVVKVSAIVLVVLSLVLLIYGLIPHDRVVSHKSLQGGYVGIYYGIPANKGDIMVIDYEVTGSDTAFYLTYDEAWSEGNQDYIEKRDHARIGHFEVDVERTGLYYLNFESNDPSSSASFNVDLGYKIKDRYSPLHIVLGASALAAALILTFIYLWLKKASILERKYIRLIIM